MESIPFLLLILFILIGLLIFGGLFSGSIMAYIHRRLPNFTGEGDTFLLWSGLIVAAFILGLVVMYVLLQA